MKDPTDEAVIAVIDAANDKLKLFLKEKGYKRFEACSVEYRGTIVSSRKEIDPGVFLVVTWHWEQQFTNRYWIMTISTYFDQFPNYEYMSPRTHFEISSITERDLHHFDQFEAQLLKARSTQITL